MSNSTSSLAYADIREILDQALTAPRSIQFEMSSDKAAMRWVSRANSFRVVERKQNCAVYPEGHSMHGASVFDTLLIKRDGNKITILAYSNEGIEIKHI